MAAQSPYSKHIAPPSPPNQIAPAPATRAADSFTRYEISNQQPIAHSIRSHAPHHGLRDLVCDDVEHLGRHRLRRRRTHEVVHALAAPPPSPGRPGDGQHDFDAGYALVVDWLALVERQRLQRRTRRVARCGAIRAAG